MSTKITNNVFGLTLMNYAARIKIWLLLDCNVQFSFEVEPCPQNSQMTTHFLKFLLIIEDACSPQDLVNAWTQSSDFRKSPPLQHSTPPPCGQFCKCQISKLIAGKREWEEHDADWVWCQWQNPVLSETLLLTHRLNRFRDLLFIFWQIAWTTIFQDRFRKLSKLGKYRVLPEG